MELLDEALTHFTARLMDAAPDVAAGAVAGLGTMGIDVSALVAGLGLTGFALGFALRDAISNLIAGALILTCRPFKRDYTIKVSGHEGRVTAIDLRYTTLEGGGERILVPNAPLFSKEVTVFEKSAAK